MLHLYKSINLNAGGGYSLDAQREKLRRYAEYEGMTVAEEYSDEGFSGKNIQGSQKRQ